MLTLHPQILTVALPALMALTACAGAEPAASQPQNLRVQIHTHAEWPSLAALGERASQATGVAVRDVAGIAPRRYALTLECTSPMACERAYARLAAENTWVEMVVPDARVPSPQSASSTLR